MADIRAPTHSAQNRDFWTEFFLLYESLPALWNTSSVLYKERAAKIAGYDIMVEKLREIEPNADREDVLRKINIFRTNYRREVGRINMSNKMGKQYRTTLWYFDLLSFLQTQESKRNRKSKTEGEKCIMPKKRYISSSSSFVVKKPRTDQLDSYDYGEDGLIMEYEGNHEDMMAQNMTALTPTKDHTAQYQNEFKNFSSNQKDETKREPLVPDVGEAIEEIEEYDDFMNEQRSTNMVEEEIEGEEECIAQTPEQEITNEWIDHNPSSTTLNKQQKTPLEHFNKKSDIQHQQSKQIQRGSTTIKRFRTQTTQTIQSSSTKGYSEASEILAKSWAIQYEEMSDDQKIYARKAIADILFEGCMRNLGGSIVLQQQDDSQDMDQNGSVIVGGKEGAASGSGNERHQSSLIKQRQHMVNSFQDVVDNYEECYVFDNGQAVKLQDWAAKMK